MKRLLVLPLVILVLAGCGQKTFDEQVYDKAKPYFYASEQTQKVYIGIICESRSQDINREYTIMAIQSLSGVDDPETTNAYIDVVTDKYCS